MSSQYSAWVFSLQKWWYCLFTTSWISSESGFSRNTLIGSHRLIISLKRACHIYLPEAFRADNFYMSGIYRTSKRKEVVSK